MNLNQFDASAGLTQISCPLLQETAEEESSEDFLRSIYESVQASIFVVDVLENGDFCYVTFNPAHERLTGIRASFLRGKTPQQVLSATEASRVCKNYTNCVRFGQTISYEECLLFKGESSWWITTLTPQRNSQGRIYRLIGTSTNITQRKQVEQELRLQAERELLLTAIATRIRQSLDLDTILNRTVNEVRHFLDCDRVLIYRFEPDWSGVMVVESSVYGPSVLGDTVKDPCFSEKYIESYRRGRMQVVEDIYAAGLTPCHIELLAAFQVRANFVVPILTDHDLWGLLVAQHCRSTRQWQETEVELLKQLATQVGIAVQQAELHSSVRRLNADLEDQVQKRTQELQLALNFEAVIRSITEKIRDSLDESHVLQAATQELAQVFNIERCKIELYNADQTQATVAYEYTTTVSLCQGFTRLTASFPEIYQTLLQKQPLQFSEITPTWNPKADAVTRLACPIFDERGVLGNLWLVKPKESNFDELEIRLVQQVANACAIAIRQARLYSASQAQVRELEKLERLKNSFLKTLSHELRTPIASIHLAAQTLESILKREGLLDCEMVNRILRILNNECRRESKLIDDLLTLTYLEAEAQPLQLTTLDLDSWLFLLVESYRDRVERQEQELYLLTTTKLPIVQTDIVQLERIVTELLNNACKYTPPREAIAVDASVTADAIYLSVTNSGIEIPDEEISRIFEPFYRIPNNDPWRHGGIGLGLALVQKLAEHIGANISVKSSKNKTTFTLKLPLLSSQ